MSLERWCVKEEPGSGYWPACANLKAEPIDDLVKDASIVCCVSVKCERVKEEPGLEQHESSSACAAEEEAGGQAECGVSAAAARAGLYAGHEVKGELVLGPTALQPSWHTDITQASTSPVNRTSIQDSGEGLPGASCGPQLRLRPCSVRLERLPASEHASNMMKCNENTLSATEAKYSRVTEKQVSGNCDADIKQMLLKIKVDMAPVTPNNDTTDKNNQKKSDVNDTECKICYKDFASRRSLYNHLKRHSGGKPFKCPYCIKSFACRRDMQRHSTVHYKENITTTQNLNDNSRIPAGTEKTEYKKKIYVCNFCDKVYDRRYLMITHELHVHFNKKQYECDICMAQFLYKQSLINHLRIHTGDKPYECKFCGDHFTQLGTLNYHLKRHQRGDLDKREQTKSNRGKPYKCEICSKQLSTKKSFNMHLTIHTGRKPYKCDVCTKAFSHKNFLNKHRLSHTKVGRFKCEFCSVEFCTQRNLEVHLSVGRRSCPESGHLCDKCGAKFERRAPLLEHMRAHILPSKQT